ncbi:PREDICTED: protein MIS12 homolog [Papilio polytes]|uniref:protein MIS12 homolog n=1 Tax=Papilio polytes TaxID=76194 RepID=UPI0006764765|nr:PREDICTED: protein MIS12 homolog [Papilio polytes]
MIKTQPWVGGTEEEYETQHFGFGAQSLKIAVRQMVEHKIKSGVKDMESYLKETLDLNNTDKLTLTHACDKLIKLYCERAGPSLEAIDSEIERLLKVPPNVLLPEDEVQLDQVSDEEYQNLKEEVALLRKRVERGASLEALLSAEDEELSSIENVCEIARKDMEILDLLQKNCVKNDVKSIKNSTEFICSLVPFLKKSDLMSDD